MSTLEEIQALVNEAQDKIQNHDFKGVSKITWPNIRNAINEYPGLNRDGKMQLALLIYSRLETLGLLKQGGSISLILDVKKLTQFIYENSTGKQSIPDWLPW